MVNAPKDVLQVMQLQEYVNCGSQAYKMAARAAVVNWAVRASALWMSCIVGSRYSSWHRGWQRSPDKPGLFANVILTPDLSQ